MKSYHLAILLLHGTNIGVNAHYVFSKLLVNNTEAPDLKYFRTLPPRIINPIDAYDRRLDPILDVESLEIRCNRNATAKAVETAVVAAGDWIGFGVSNISGYALHTVDGRGLIFHSGPGQLYLSKAPGDLEAYEGDGEWFKIGEYGAKDSTHWVLGVREFWLNFTIPKAIPPGKYLARVEHMYSLYGGRGDLQFYVSCAHIEVTGPGGCESLERSAGSGCNEASSSKTGAGGEISRGI